LAVAWWRTHYVPQNRRSGPGWPLNTTGGVGVLEAKALKRRNEIYLTLHPETKHGGAPGEGRPRKMLHDATFSNPTTLSDLGIERTQAHRAQQLALIPADMIREYVQRQKVPPGAGARVGSTGPRGFTEVSTSAPRWHPHQLRHSVAAKIRSRFGLKAVSVFLATIAARWPRAPQVLSKLD